MTTEQFRDALIAYDAALPDNVKRAPLAEHAAALLAALKAAENAKGSDNELRRPSV